MKTLLHAILLTLPITSIANTLQLDSATTDSTRAMNKSAVIKRISVRLHSSGFFNFSGRMCSQNPAVDVSGNYEVAGFGVSVFTAKDLYEKSSENNFAFGILYKRFKVSQSLSITPNAGLVVDVFGNCGDRTLLISSMRASKKLTIDGTTFFANVLSNQEKEWLNRLRLIYSQTQQLQFTVSTWHNNAVLDNDQYVSGAFQVSYNRIPVAARCHLNTSVSYFQMVDSTEEVSASEVNGMVFTIGLTME